MVGARTLAMALNRLVDAELDARNPRTACRELPAGALSRAQVLALCARRARALSRRGLPARPDRALALADPRGDVRRLPLSQARHLALPPLARSLARAGSGRCVAAVTGGCPGRRGRSAVPSRSGSPASTSSTRCSTWSTTASRACTRGRPASASGASSRRAACFHVGALALLARSGHRSRPRRSVLARFVAVAALLVYEHSLVRPGDLRRLDAAFFTVNGVISIVFLVLRRSTTGRS